MKRLLSLLISLVAYLTPISAQEFIINPWGADELICYSVNKTSEGFSVVYNKEQGLSFSEGERIQKIGESENGYYYIFCHEGKYYAAQRQELKFSNNNPDDMENPLSEKIQARGSLLGKFYGSNSAITIIILLTLTGAIISLGYITLKISLLRPIFLVFIPCAILAVSLIQIVGYIKFSTDIFWWCEYDRYGFFGSLWRVIPFMAVVAAQLYSIKVYEIGLFNGDETGKKISVKPAFISLAICIPVLLVTIFALAGMGIQGFWLETIGFIAFVGSLSIGLLLTLKRNAKSFGAINGLWATIFTIIYSLGCIMSGIGLIMLIFQIIFQILVVVGAFFILAFAIPRRRYVKDGRVYEEY
ncbi:MAG: hypothetical protein J6Q31_05680 [Alistipes sp.]|nr:hypothetical protein [Alistipes sp.]MBO7195481.1 hypothetical protein [Alistipes sp.]